MAGAGLERTLLLGGLMALGAFSIDVMLPGLSAIAAYYHTTETRAQLVVGAYFLGFALGQLVHGPLSDARGRKPVLLWALGGFFLTSLGTLWAPSFGVLIALRFVQGFFGAAMRTVGTAVIRDLYRGAAMARVLSLALLVLLVAPIVAPSVGVALLAWSWRALFGFLAVLSGALGVWVALRLEETLPPARRQRQSFAHLRKAARALFLQRVSLAYTLLLGFVFGMLYTYLSASPQLYKTHLGLSNLAFALAFGATGAFQVAGSLANSAWVVRIGLPTMLRWTLRGLTLTALLLVPHAALFPSPWSLWFHLSLGLVFVTTTFPNAQSRAIEPLGHIAGFASSVMGFLSTLLAGLFSTLIGQLSKGAPPGFALGWALLALGAFALGRWAESRSEPGTINP